MNKADLINALAEETGFTKVDSKKALDAFISVVTKSLKKEERVSLVGFGTFSVTERKSRTGVNPSTKKPIEIPARKVAKFKPGADLLKELE